MELQTNVKSGDLKITSPEPNEVVTKDVVTKEEPKVDLVTRASQVKVEPTAEKTVTEPEFDFKEIEKIQDPAAKDYALKAYKSFQKGFNQKFQEIAEIRKSLESKATESPNWTPERIQALLNDQNFVSAAQSVLKAPEPTGDEYSALSDADKKRLQVLEAQQRQIAQTYMATIKTQQDTQLKEKYANYKPDAVDTLTAEMLTGKYQATREDIWKAYDYEDAVRRAYQLGLEDKKIQQQDKIASSSVEGTNAVNTESTLKKAEKESGQEFFKRLYEHHLSKSRTEQVRR